MEQQIQKIRMPDRTQRLYTVQDYRLALERAKGDVRKAGEQEEARGCGFGFFYMNLVHAELEAGGARHFSEFFGRLYQYGSAEGTKKRAEIINTDVDQLRRTLTFCLNGYIRHQKGIDIWPTPGIQDVIQMGGKIMEDGRRKDLPPFDFLAHDFYVHEKDERLYIGRDPGFKCHGYKSGLSKTKDHELLDKKRKQLEMIYKPTKGDRRWNNFMMCIAAVPMLIAVYWVLMLITMHLFGLDGNAMMAEFVAFLYENENNKLSYLLLVPFLLTVIPTTFYPLLALHPVVFWGSIVFLVIAGYMITYNMKGYKKWITKKQYLDGIAAQIALDALVNNKDYQQMQKDHERRQREDEEFARFWQEEWVAVCKEKYLALK